MDDPLIIRLTTALATASDAEVNALLRRLTAMQSAAFAEALARGFVHAPSGR